jgi:hypothetical protein
MYYQGKRVGIYSHTMHGRRYQLIRTAELQKMPFQWLEQTEAEMNYKEVTGS